ncbi:DUF5819 family protein [Peterkaempfera bronchialis]|uniref:DUF5819 family protein n=1 Tax=Peterkaempfera bronchialis TaxID=2126346 RepID=UPI003C2DEA6F
MEQPSGGEASEQSAASVPDEPAVQDDPAAPSATTPEDPASDDPASEDPASEDPASPVGRTWSTPAQAALSLGAVVLLVVGAWHLAMVFLHVAPASSVTQKYQTQVDAWVYPEFEQNWKLFAPNPLQQNITVDARVKTLGADGSQHTGSWVGLTAQDIADIRHNPLPSHVEQNLLRRAWDVYSSSHNEQGDNTGGQRGDLLQQYIKRIALQRLGRDWHGEQVVEVQLRTGTDSVAPPPWSTETWPLGAAYRELPWWPVTDQDYAGL